MNYSWMISVGDTSLNLCVVICGSSTRNKDRGKRENPLSSMETRTTVE